MQRDEQLINFADLKTEQLRAIQLELLKILEIFDKFCKENDLRYYLASGTCIGAIRHKGFIPWDDDLDVAMPRDDYEKLFKLWNNENNRYKVIRPSKDILTGFIVGQVRDSQTTCIYDHARNYDICHGFKIDIEVIDGCPNGALAKGKQKFFWLVYGLMSAQRIPNQGTKRRKIVAKVILSIIRFKKLRCWLFIYAEHQLKKYRIKDCSDVRLYDFVYPKDYFEKPYMAEFEGGTYPVPCQYDKYLKVEYGDYMQYPPEECRKPTTKVYYYNLNVPYEQYKGIKYCMGSK